MKLLLPIIFLIASSTASAGGYHFEVVVKSITLVEGSWHRYTAILSPTSSEAQWPEEKCEILSVEGEFDSERWVRYKRPMSTQTHKASIDLLLSSIGKPVLFGIMGSGLKQISPCSYKSKGLFVEPYGGKGVVMSVHNRI